jgi:exopolysaccharide production protein ExoQ
MSYPPIPPGRVGLALPTTPTRAITIPSIAAWLGGLFCLYMFAQGWEGPLTNYAITAGDSALLRNAFLPVYGVVAAMMVAQAPDIPKMLLREPLVLALLGLAAASTFWSVDPSATVRRVLALGFTTLAAVLIAGRWSWRSLAEMIGACFAINGVLSLVIAVLKPDWGRMTELFPGAWRGVWLEKNALGGLMSMGALAQVAAALYVPRRRLLWIAMAALSMLLVLMSQSKTSLVSLILGFGVIFACWLAHKGPAMAVALLWAAVTVIGGAGAVLALAPHLLLDSLGKDATLTGRTVLWAAAWRQYLLHPTLGYGYGVLWDYQSQWSPGAWITHDAKFKAGHAHNGWLETALGLGAVGEGLWIAYFVQVCWRSLKAFFLSTGAILALPYLVIFTVRTITESEVLRYHNVEWMLFVLLAAKMAYPVKAEDQPGG